VEKHFRAVHKDTIIKPVETHTVGGVLSRNLRCQALQQLVRSDWERQKYFPLQLATGLSRQFATHGLHFFKVNKTFTHVSVARPQFLDLETTPVSESIKRIVGHINTHPKCTRRQLIEALAPSPKKPTVIEIKTAAPPAAAPAPAPDASGEAAAAPQDSSAAPAVPTAPASPATDEPTAEQTVIIADLHWLVHQGHVLEFADGRMDTAKKPLPRPAKPEKKPAGEKPAAEGETATPAVDPAGEVPVLTEAEIPASEPELAVESGPATEATAETPTPTQAAAPQPEVQNPAAENPPPA
jgi:hypothetical protein